MNSAIKMMIGIGTPKALAVAARARANVSSTRFSASG